MLAALLDKGALPALKKITFDDMHHLQLLRVSQRRGIKLSRGPASRAAEGALMEQQSSAGRLPWLSNGNGAAAVDPKGSTAVPARRPAADGRPLMR